MRITDQARANREYVRRLLKARQPGFAVLLESVERELACPVCLGPRLFRQPSALKPSADRSRLAARRCATR